MRLIACTLPTLEENLALDEALLDEAEMHAIATQNNEALADTESLRIWESPTYAAVLGRSSPALSEVNRSECDQRGVPIGRRCSGGATVVIGRGCLMYGVIISLAKHPECRMIDQAHRLVMGKLLEATRPYEPTVTMDGICDLTIDGRKFSGNSVRVKKHHMLYHGTLLYDFDIALIQHVLNHPVREPEYREHRSHEHFLTNLRVDRQALVDALRNVWNTDDCVKPLPFDSMRELIAQRYSQQEWTFRH